MNAIRVTVLAVVMFTLAGGTAAPSADTAGPVRPGSVDQAKPGPQTLQLTVTISRFNGAKKVSSIPFVLVTAWAAGGNTRPTTVQMGSEVPVPQTTVTDGKAVASYRYQQIGTNIQAFAESAYDDGRFNINLSITDSQVLSDMGSKDAPPRFQTFKVSNNLILRDGQTIQFVAATDKASGEVAQVDVVLNVIK